MNALPKFSKPTPQPAHIDRVAKLGCMICGAVSVVHHLTEIGSGRITRNDAWVAPLCPQHHNMGDESIHLLGSRALFDATHETDLLQYALLLQRESMAMGIIR